MNAQKNAQKHYPFAWSLTGSGLITLIGLAILAVLVPITIASLLLVAAKTTSAIIAFVVGLVLLGIIIAAFKVKVKRFNRTTFLKFENVPKMTALVLRWRLAGSQIDGSQVDPRDPLNLIWLAPGLTIYSPWLFVAEGLVDLAPKVIPQKPQEVNSKDGPLISVDLQATIRVKDPILFILNAGNRPDDILDIIKEYLHRALQNATSVEEGEPVELFGEPVELPALKGWPCKATKISNISEKQMKDMSHVITNWMNYWLNDDPKGPKFGFEINVGVTSIQESRLVLAAQESAAAVGLQAEEMKTEGAAQAEVIKSLCSAVPGVNPTIVATAVAILPTIRDVIEQVVGGRKGPGGDKGKEKTENTENTGKQRK